MMAKVSSPEYQEMIGKTREIAKAAKEAAKSSIALVTQLQQVGTAAAGGVASAATAGQAAGGAGEEPAPKESFTANGKKLSEGQVYMIFNRAVTQQLNEGPMDFIKGVAAKGMDKLKTAGKNLTTSVTADKLNSAWKKAGSPTDSKEVAKILTTAGVSANNVKQIYTDLKLPAPGAAAETPAELDSAALEKMIASMTAKDKKRLAQYITKQLGTA
jgi:hypothetical protein